VARVIPLAPQITGFKFPNLTNPPAPDTLAFPNQLQSVVIRGESAYLPNIAASPTGPLRFSLDTHAFVNLIAGANSTSPLDFGATNLHLGARVPKRANANCSSPTRGPSPLPIRLATAPLTPSPPAATSS